MTNPTYLVSGFTTDLSATDRAGATAWTVTGTAGTFSDDQMHLDTGDAVSITTVAHLNSAKGAVSFRFTRESDTGSDEYLLECGQDGYDWLRIYVDGSTDKLILWWAIGGALPQTVESGQTVALDTLYFVSCDWQHTAMSLTVGEVGSDGFALTFDTVSGTRDVPIGSWGGDSLTLLAGDPTGVYSYGAYGAGPYGA